jgi:hypothetical protein
LRLNLACNAVHIASDCTGVHTARPATARFAKELMPFRERHGAQIQQDFRPPLLASA